MQDYVIFYLSLFINLFVFISILRVEYKLQNRVSVKTFYVKTAFAFPESNSRYVGICSYFHENALNEQALKEGLTFGEYIQRQQPDFKFDGVQAINQSAIQKLYNLPQRLHVTEDSLQKYQTIIFANKVTIAVMTKPGNKDPHETYWFGTLIQAETPRAIKQILKQYRKQVKNGSCDIVQS